MKRVIPRDLFNDANLLKCYGQLYLELERLAYTHVELVNADEWIDTSAFDIGQTCDGETYLLNVVLYVRGEPQHLYRPMNSRDNYPLYMRTRDDDVSVFDEAGKLTQKFVAYLKGEIA